MPRLDDAAMLQRLTACTLIARIARLDVDLQAAHAVAEHDSPAWHLFHEARIALLRLISYLDIEEA